MLPRLAPLVLGLLSAAPAFAQTSPGPAMTLLPASDARFLFEGRFDRADVAHPVLIWSGSRVGLDFSGGHAAIRFGAARDQSVFNLTVDGATEIVDVRSGPARRYRWPHALGPGRHRLELFKRSEAAKGQVVFDGVELDPGAAAWAPPAPAYRLRMEFFGDSITAGACNEDGAVDQWEDLRSHNHALSYDYLTSQAFVADHRAMAVSGMGIVIGWEPMLAGQVWDKLYPRADSPRADLTAWVPDVAFVNLGENDDSFTERNALPFPPAFAAEYVALVRAIRAAHPRTQLVLLRGGMAGGAKSEKLRTAWESAVRELEHEDPRVAHFVFTHFSVLHPRVSDQRAMAAELTSWLKRQPFMASFLKD